MAKHAHRILLMSKKTWRCTLDGCNYFVHQGLSYVLEGTQVTCFECGEEFKATGKLMQAARDTDDMLMCSQCREGIVVESPNEDTLEGRILIGKVLTKNNIKKLAELGMDRVRALQSMGELPKFIPESLMGSITESDEPLDDSIESEDVHTDECLIGLTGRCTCM